MSSSVCLKFVSFFRAPANHFRWRSRHPPGSVGHSWPFRHCDSEHRSLFSSLDGAWDLDATDERHTMRLRAGAQCGIQASGEPSESSARLVLGLRRVQFTSTAMSLVFHSTRVHTASARSGPGASVVGGASIGDHTTNEGHPVRASPRPASGRVGSGSTSKTRLKGVSAARRKRLKPASATTSAILAGPAWAPRARPTSWESDAGVTGGSRTRSRHGRRIEVVLDPIAGGGLDDHPRPVGSEREKDVPRRPDGSPMSRRQSNVVTRS